ncbi:MAG: hypothetical protein CM1200mP18_15950 [Gammaproteobacteria bacterium]|nr:MAG: hypothetical protein CM1200mP18_15950 [Gammaproteobacteria bacterium]
MGPQVFDLDTYVVVKGAPNEKEAIEFLKFCTSAEALADTTNYISYGPYEVVIAVRQSGYPAASADCTGQLQNSTDL